MFFEGEFQKEAAVANIATTASDGKNGDDHSNPDI